MISRGAFIAGIAAILMSRRADAQPTAKVYHLGMLSVILRPINEQFAPGAIASKLRELGWEEGRNLSIDYRFSASPDAMPQLSTSLVASQPDILIALGPYPASNAELA